jgi:hypothetical protein
VTPGSIGWSKEVVLRGWKNYFVLKGKLPKKGEDVETSLKMIKILKGVLFSNYRHLYFAGIADVANRRSCVIPDFLVLHSLCAY